MSYHIADEPTDSPFSAYVCRPSAPMLAMMLAGAWLAWPWFIFNSIALGSPTKKKEIQLVLAGILGTAVMAVLVVLAIEEKWIESLTTLRFAVLAIVTWKLTIANAVKTLQGRTFHVYEYYGGKIRNPRNLVGAGYYLRDLLLSVFDNPVWIIILAGLSLQQILGVHRLWNLIAGGAF
ncbi:MAG TPA: hypothetical protein VGM39_19625 [Kofleriaceae bacterium]|jgi:hypothetical protein